MTTNNLQTRLPEHSMQHNTYITYCMRRKMNIHIILIGAVKGGLWKASFIQCFRERWTRDGKVDSWGTWTCLRMPRLHRPYVGHRNERWRWAGRYRHWRLQCWDGVLFSEESCFHLRNADGRLWVWWRRVKRHHYHCLVQTDRLGGSSVMVWGGSSYHHRTALHVCRDHLLSGWRHAKWRHSLLSSALG